MAKAKRNHRSQRERVVELIQQSIVDGKLAPGERLGQIPLSQAYQVSQSVVRESLTVLEQRGLVTSRNQAGFVVRQLDRLELADAYQVREVLEGLAARLCCRKASREDIECLTDLAHQIHAKAGEKLRAKRSELEYQFHQYFLHLSANETLQRVSVGYRFVGNLVVTGRAPDELLVEHMAVVEAVSDNHPDEAERAARRHVARSAQAILESM